MSVVVQPSPAEVYSYLSTLFVERLLSHIGTDFAYPVVVNEEWAVAETSLGETPQGATWAKADKTMKTLYEFHGVLHLLHLQGGQLEATLAGPTKSAVADAFVLLRQRYDALALTDLTVSITFWALGAHGPMSYRRALDVPTWASISDNYPGTTRSDLDALLRWQRPALGGQLVLWYGVPGTGKTWAIRALASEWRQWCQLEYITDPDKLFGNASYLTQVLLEQPEGVDDGRWRCLVLEDTGEFLTTDAKAHEGQALSRLLNVADGLLGQGLRVLLLMTTNEEIRTLHPAVTRPGRALYQVAFTPFQKADAAAWLQNRGAAAVMLTSTLAELYSTLAPPRPTRESYRPGF